MSGKRPVKGEPWVKTPLHVAKARLRLSINAQRFLDFLMIEHMGHGGQRNGYLMAPRRQLQHAGIGARHVSSAIEEAEQSGLVVCQRGIGRRPNYYALSWLPMLIMTSEGIPQRYPKGSPKRRSDFRREVTKAENRGYPKGSHSIEVLTTGEAGISVVEGMTERRDVGLADRATAPVVIDAAAVKGGAADVAPSPNSGEDPLSRCAFRIVTPLGERICGMLAPAGSDLCVDHVQRALRCERGQP